MKKKHKLPPKIRPLQQSLYFFLAVFFVLNATLLRAQEDSVPLESNPSGDSLEEDPPLDQRSDLLTDSLEYDISTAQYDELVLWCRILELDDQGSQEVLMQRLRTYYALETPTKDLSGSEKKPSRIVIESARRSEYFNVNLGDEDEETMVRLTGEVILTVEEPEKKKIHRVAADTVLFNQKQNTISALGNIIYTVDSDGKEERFTGDGLTFEVTDWVGVIFQGSSSRQENVDGQSIDFFFHGESIKKIKQDILILEKGVITSDTKETPDYSLKAKKIWITGPGEWGLLSATLYVGHIPVFYFPFYWKSGAKLFFNPVIGHRSRVGYLVQTTTYLLGSKEESDDFTFLGFGDSASSDYELTREGLFLVKKGKLDSSTTVDNRMLKFMLDLYTSLGAVVILQGDFPDFLGKGKLDFYTSVGVSRSVDDSGSIYFNQGSSGLPQVYWNNSYLGKAVLPFRWGNELNLVLDKWSIAFNWYSDPFYLRDFANRKENFDWLNFLLEEEGTDTKDAGLVTDMKWEVKGSYSANMSKTKPWFSKLSLDSVRTSLGWRNKTNQGVSQSTNPDKAYDPARNFYYPDRLILPDMNLSLGGGSPSWTIQRDQKTLSKPEILRKEEKKEPISSEANENSPPQPPSSPYQDSLPEAASRTLLRTSFDYDANTQFYIEDESLSSDWDQPSDIDFRFQAAKISSVSRGNLSHRLDLWDGVTGFNGSTSLLGYFQKHSDIFGTGIPIEDNVKLEDFNYNKMIWNNKFFFFIKPFHRLPQFSSSQLSYNFDGELFSKNFGATSSIANPSYENSWISGPENFRKHELRSLIKGTITPFNISFSSHSNLPPLDIRHILKSSMGLSFDRWNISFSQQSTYEEDEWEFHPVNMNFSWNTANGKLSFSQATRLDVEENRLSYADFRLKLWDFNIDFVMDYGEEYHWNKTSFLWQAGAEKFHPKSLEFSYKKDWSPAAFWRNRLKYSSTVSSSWKINLLQPTANTLAFTWNQTLSIFRFLDLKFSFVSSNKSMYLYFPKWREELGLTGDNNFFMDLIRSFNVFSSDQQDRRDSFFNMESLSVSLVHHLGSWDATFEYRGWPALDSGTSAYRWKSDFSFFIKWNALPLFRQRSQYKDDAWTVDSFGEDS